MTTDLDFRKGICRAYGLSEVLADRLLGNNEDELHSDAEKLAEIVKKRQETAPITPELLKDLSAEEVNARWPDIEKHLSTGSGERGPLPDRLTFDVVRTMTEAEVNERWDEVLKVLARGR